MLRQTVLMQARLDKRHVRGGRRHRTTEGAEYSVSSAAELLLILRTYTLLERTEQLCCPAGTLPLAGFACPLVCFLNFTGADRVVWPVKQVV